MWVPLYQFIVKPPFDLSFWKCWKCQHIPVSACSSLSVAAAVLLFLTTIYPPPHSHSLIFTFCFSSSYIFFFFPLRFSPVTTTSPSLFHSRRKTSGSSTPDSLLKKSLLPTSSIYPTTSSTNSSLQTDCSSSNAENHHHQRKQLMSNYSRLTKTTSLISPSIEMITRGPDGRFMLPSYVDDTLSVGSRKKDQHSRVRRSVSLHLEREDKNELPYVLSVDFTPCKPKDESMSQLCDMEHCDTYVPDQKMTYDPDLCSLYTNSSLTTVNLHNREITPVFPVLPHIRSGFGQPYTTASALVLQMEHERETGNLSRCLKLAQEREELERELQRCLLERKNSFRETKKEEDVEQFVWKNKSSTLPSKYRHGSKENSFSSSPVHWEAHPHDSHPNLIPSRNHLSSPPTSTPNYFDSYRSSPFTHQTFLQPDEADHYPRTLPRPASKHLTCESLDTPPNGFKSSNHSKIVDVQTNCSSNCLSHENSSSLSFHSNQYKERSKIDFGGTPDSPRVEVMFPRLDEKDVSIEMSVDEPEFEASKPMLHHRIASHLHHGRPLTQRCWHEDIKRSPASVENMDWVHQSRRPSEPELWRAQSRGLKIRDHKQRSQSLDLRRQKQQGAFLTPDAWIDSLSQENCSVPSSCQPDASSPRPAVQTTSSSSPAVDHLSTRSCPQWLVPDPAALHHRKLLNNASLSSGSANRPVVHQDASAYLPPINNNLEVEAEGYEEVPESGGSYSSYASSGRGSMETNNCSPETVEGNSTDEHGHQVRAR